MTRKTSRLGAVLATVLVAASTELAAQAPPKVSALDRLLSSPRDLGKLLEKIEKGEAVSKPASEQMLQILRGQVYSSRLPKYVTGFRVPHKTGDFLPYIGNDVGVLESPNRHVVVSIFTAHHNGIGPYLEDAIARIGEQVANYFAFRESPAP